MKTNPYIILYFVVFFINCSTNKENDTNSLEESSITSLQSIKDFEYVINNGLIEKEIIRTREFFNGQLYEKYIIEKIYEYNQDNQLVFTKHYRIDRNTKELVREYGYKENIITEIYFSEGDTLIFNQEIFVDGLKVKEISRMKNTFSPDAINEIKLFNYTIAGELNKIEVFDLNNELISVHKYNYDTLKNKDKTQITTRDDSGNIIEIEYNIFDLNNDLVYKITELPDIAIDSFIYSNGIVVKEIFTDLQTNNKDIIENIYSENRLIKQKEFKTRINVH